jgi:hypothetical protein
MKNDQFGGKVLVQNKAKAKKKKKKSREEGIHAFT